MKTYLFIIIIFFYQLLSACNSGKQVEEKQTIDTNPIEQKEEVVGETEAEAVRVDAMCDSCTIDKFRYVRLQAEKIVENDIFEFLLCCNESCAINVEFSEFSNYLVFYLLENRTNLTIKTIENKTEELSMYYIQGIIESPVSDQIDLQNIYLKVEESESTSEIKNMILTALKTAIDKY